MKEGRTKSVLPRMAAVLLMFGVVWLWTFVKHNGYLPKSNVSRHVHAAMKLEVAQSKVEAVRAPLLPTGRLVLTGPRFGVTQLSDPQIPPRQDAGLDPALQRRPPPPQRA